MADAARASDDHPPAHARIVITRELAGDAIARLRHAGFTNIWVYPENRTIPRSELLEAVRGAAAIIATPADASINAELFDAAGPSLRIVSNYAVGVDNIDLEEAAKRSVLVGHTPNAVTEPTADIAWLLMLGVARRVHEAQTEIYSGDWTGVAPQHLLGRRVLGKTLFIIGAGRIGFATARRSIGWNMSVLYHARSQHEDFERPPVSAARVTIEDGLARADFISLHTPLSSETRQLINADRLAQMKRTAYLINTARGAVIDEHALVDALVSGRIAGAGLDVYENEPAIHPMLKKLPNVFLLPHLGSATIEDRIWTMEVAVDNVIAALRGEPLPHEFPKG